MRDIKFRGKHKNPYGDKWVHGYYAMKDGKHVIIMPHAEDYIKSLNEPKPISQISVEHTIDVNTLGQYTGLRDKNGVEIYEGDIVKICSHGRYVIGKIIYEHCGFTADVTHNKELPYGRSSIIQPFVEVIGNIYDNPELF